MDIANLSTHNFADCLQNIRLFIGVRWGRCSRLKELNLANPAVQRPFHLEEDKVAE